jgi:hypothetical protein
VIVLQLNKMNKPPTSPRILLIWSLGITLLGVAILYFNMKALILSSYARNWPQVPAQLVKVEKQPCKSRTWLDIQYVYTINHVHHQGNTFSFVANGCMAPIYIDSQYQLLMTMKPFVVHVNPADPDQSTVNAGIYNDDLNWISMLIIGSIVTLVGVAFSVKEYRNICRECSVEISGK